MVLPGQSPVECLARAAVVESWALPRPLYWGAREADTGQTDEKEKFIRLQYHLNQRCVQRLCKARGLVAVNTNGSSLRKN